ncbi:uncharacterized protein KY384_002089 [Bacidia gigantensis]|uniref:uncharacterized protein n=1 Tax=Bacidia gigantensis TaxID=2732470 RepID=UPI001D03ED41|nr:uncharacterized protein KY384_002089 [Bacidia gigantensis]KAG8533306.1 hypothetical protein KY384_002089 [Bacidia gigantensis]
MSDSDTESTLTDLSSELSSAPPSPIFPAFSLTAYPTPDSSQAQSTYSSSSEQDSRKRRRKHDDFPTEKKRKVTAPKERSTLRLDLRSSLQQPVADSSVELDTLLKALRKKRKIVVVAGAGISTSAGVPDFRSTKGLFNTLRNDNKLKASGKQLFDASVYQTDASTSSFHDMVRMLSRVVDGAQPTAFHHLLATLADEGRLLRLYTQNVDGIDAEIEPLKTAVPLPKKGPWPRTVQLHGSLKKMVCAKCGDLRDCDPALFDGPDPPSCSSCADLDKVRTEEAGKRSHGIGKLRPRMVLYHEDNPDAEAIGSIVTSDLRARPDALIVVGTTMEIPGVQRMVREMCKVIQNRKDGKCIWINRGPPPTGPKFEDIWDLVVAGDCDRVAELADMRRWYEEPREGVRVTDSDAERAKAKKTGVKVILQSAQTIKTSSPAELPNPLPSPPLEAEPGKSGIKLIFRPAKDKKPKKLCKSQQSQPPKEESKGKKTTKSGCKPQIRQNLKPKKVPAAGFKPITSTFKVTKLQDPTTGVPKKVPEDPKPFDPVPPQSARSNSNGSPLEGTVMRKLEKIEVKIEDSNPKTGRLKRMSQESISPTGKLPKALAHILN